MLLYKNLKFDFSSRVVSKLLINELRRLKEKQMYRILDVGCGDGVMIDDLQHLFLLKKNFNLTAIDLLPENIRIAKKRGLNANFQVANTEHLPFIKNRFDFIYSWMVLEHVSSPKNMAKEIARVLKIGAYCYLATIIRKKWALYIYWKNGHFTLDPTHIHEFKSKEELFDLLENNGLKIKEFELNNCKYSLFELFMKLLIKVYIIRPSIENRKFFSKNPLLNFLKEKSKITVPGFYIIDLVCYKK